MDLLNQLAAFLLPIIQAQAAQHPVIFTVAVAMGAFRMFFKPISSCVHSIVELTATKKDDELVDKVEKSKWYVGIMWAVDYITSIKVIPPKS